MIDPIARSLDAQRLLDEPLLKEAFEAIEKTIIDKLRGPANGHELELVMALRLTGQIKGWIQGVVQTGKVEIDLRERAERNVRVIPLNKGNS